MILRAITLDYWDTLYHGVTLPARVVRRSAAVRALVSSLGHDMGDAEWEALYRESGRVADDWWRSGRGYVATDRVRWVLERVGLECEEDDPRLADVLRAVDETLLEHPPALLEGAAAAVRAFAAAGLRLAIVSDTGFASGTAQTALLERDGLASHFGALIYSCDIGWAKPHASTFRAALDALEVSPAEALHVGDIERTDIAGALGAGMRAVRVDILRESGPSAAELVARSWDEVLAHVGARRAD